MYGKVVRIASVSDLHVDFPENREVLVRLATEIHRAGADLVVVAGDVSHVDDHIARTLRAFRIAAPRVAYLPGNHDLWFARKHAEEDPDVDSWRRYREDLRVLVEAENCHYLPAQPLYLGSVALVGTTGWYDYSLIRPEVRTHVGEAALREKRWAGAEWSDARYAIFRDASGGRMSDPEVAKRMEEDLVEQLDAVDRNPDVQDVVAATHVLAFAEALGGPKGLPWDYFDAFMGSRGLGEVLRRSPKVRAAIYGHTHRPGRFDLHGIHVHGTPLGYPRERRGIPRPDVVTRSIGWLELPESDSRDRKSS